MDRAKALRLCAALLLPFVLSRTAAALDPGVKPAALQFLEDFGAHWTFDFTPDRHQIVSVTGRPDDVTTSPDAMASLLFQRIAAFRFLPASTFTDASLTTSDDVREYVWQQKLGSMPIDNAFVLVTFHPESGLYDVISNAVPQQTLPDVHRTVQEAKETAKAALYRELGIESDARKQPSLIPAIAFVTATASNATVLLAAREVVHRVYYVTVTAYASDGMRALAKREYAIDATASGERPDDLLVRSRDLMPQVRGTTQIFNPNPANALNDITLKPQNVSTTSTAYEPADLNDLKPAVQGKYELSGPYIQILNLEKPDEQPPKVTDNGNDPPFVFFRGGADFAATMVYVHIDRMQRYVESTLGFAKLVQKPLIADVSVQDTNTTLTAGYIHRDPNPGYLWFSQTGGIYAAEDADVIAHEYGHALLSQKSKGRFDINRTSQNPLSEATSVAEGFCDYWALSYTFAKTNGRFNVDCFAEWAAATNKCFRTYTKKPYYTMFDGAFGADPHNNAEVWSGVLYDIFKLVGNTENTRETADKLILRGQRNRMNVGDAPTIQEMANGIVIADSQKFSGSYKNGLCTLFDTHKIPKPACCIPNGCSAKLTQPAPPLPFDLQ